MSKVSKFCVEKEYYLHFSKLKYSLPSLYKYSLLLRQASADGTLTFFFKALWFLLHAVSKLGKTELDQELQ